MKPIDYKEFKKINKITNLNIADYLGVSEAYVSMATSGKTQFSAERLQKILEHPTWNITPLLKDVRYQADMSTAPSLPDGTTYTPSAQPLQPTTNEALMKAEIERLIAITQQQSENIAELIAQQGILLKLIAENTKK